jgi:hypothetical protein
MAPVLGWETALAMKSVKGWEMVWEMAKEAGNSTALK